MVTYFGGDDTLAEQALSAAPPELRSRMSIQAFGHADLGLLLGVIAIAAGLEASAHDPSTPQTSGTRLRSAVARPSTSSAMRGFGSDCGSGVLGPERSTAIPALATVAVGLWAAAAQVVALVLVFAVLFAFESRRGKQLTSCRVPCSR
mgnify:CR=1 FL=1